MQPFKVEERDLGTGLRELSVCGELDLAVADRLKEAISAQPSGCNIVIGLNQCEFIDSTGIAVIIRAHQRFAESSRRLVVCCPKDQTERVLQITGLIECGLVFETLDEAVAATGT